MIKAIVQLFITFVVFFFTWFLFSQVNWVGILEVEKATNSTEAKLGKIFWNQYSAAEVEIKSPEVLKPIDSMVYHICRENDIDPAEVKLHIFNKDEVNAFTLPDNYLVIYSGLIEASQNEAELMGVIGHELAHMKNKHVMKKLVKEVGLSMLISATTGGSGDAVQSVSKALTSSAFDRSLESEADLAAVDYLINANIDPEPFANFLYKLSLNEGDMPSQLYWISTHPASKERAESLINYISSKSFSTKSVLSDEEWRHLKEEVKRESEVFNY